MSILKQNKIPMILGTAILTIALAYGGTVFASHSFEVGVQGDSIPDNTHIRLDGLTLQNGTIFPLYDASPNYVSGHFLMSAPCEPVAPGDDTYRPTVTVIAGHVDEHDMNTNVQMVPLYYINTVSNAPNSCIWHAHIPDPVNGGAPRVTDIDLINLSGGPITFQSGNIVDINIQRVLGDIGRDSYENGPTVGFSSTNSDNPVYDLNDMDTTNDGLGAP